MFSQVSYNIVVERFKAFADGHYLIKRFSHGQIDVTDIMKDAEYPWMHIVPVSMNPSTGSRSFSFDIIFADLPRDKEDKTEYQRESLSDCMRLAEDLLAEIQNGYVIFGQDVELEQGATISPFMEEYTHVLTGVTLSLTMTFPWDWNACEIPADWSAGGSGSGGTGGGGGASLLLKVNDVDNVIQTILNITAGSNMTITDMGDGRVKFDATGDIGTTWGTIGGILSNQTDLQNALDLKVDIASLASVAFSGDYGDLTNTPTIPTLLDDLDDVKVPSPNDGEVLTYDTGTGFWISAPAPTGQQGLQDVLIEDSTLTQANLIDASGFNFEIQNVYDFNVTGSYRGTIKSTIPSTGTSQGLEYGTDFVKIESQNNTTIDYGQVLVTSQGVGISTQSGTDLTAINMSPTQIGIRTPNVVDGIASVGQVLTLQNATTGDVEYTSVGVGDMTKAEYDPDNDGIVESARKEMLAVINKTGATLTKGTIVYLKSTSSSGTHPEVLKASALTEATSSKTIGGIYEDIPNDEVGYVVTSGEVDNLDTSAYSIGQQLWLSNTAGQVQTTPATDPSHAVFIGTITRSQNNNGRLLYHIQNGYELNELHDVSVPSPASQDYLYYDGGTSLWKSKQLVASAITDSTDTGRNVLTIPNPSAIRYLRINADNSVSALTASQLKSDLGFITQIQSTQLTNSSSSLNVTISGCTIALEANTTYVGKMTIASGSVPVLGYTLVFNFPTGTIVRAGRTNSSSSTSAQVMLWQEMVSGTAFGTQFGNAQNQIGYAEIQLYISVGATAGNFTQDFRSGTNGSAITIYAGLTSIQLQKV